MASFFLLGGVYISVQKVLLKAVGPQFAMQLLFIPLFGLSKIRLHYNVMVGFAVVAVYFAIAVPTMGHTGESFSSLKNQAWTWMCWFRSVGHLSQLIAEAGPICGIPAFWSDDLLLLSLPAIVCLSMPGHQLHDIVGQRCASGAGPREDLSPELYDLARRTDGHRSQSATLA